MAQVLAGPKAKHFVNCQLSIVNCSVKVFLLALAVWHEAIGQKKVANLS